MTNKDENLGPRILIVDDNPNIHRDFELVLLGSGESTDLDADERRMYGPAAKSGDARPEFALDHAMSGLEGVEKVKQSLSRQQPYQVAFVDVRMPGIDGVEAIEQMWRIDPAIQMVICTAYADYSWQDLTRRLGPTDKLLLLKKPFDNIEVTLLASTLAKKWSLAKQAALKLEEMELLVARRTRKVLELQRLESAKPAPEASFPAATDPTTPTEPPMILVVEETGDAARIVRELGADYRVLTATGGDQGVQQAREAVPDLIVAEGGLTGLDGIALCRRLKRDELASHIPVILLGDDGLEDTQIKALEAGADDFLSRPFTLPVLRARMENLLRSRRTLQEHLGQVTTLQPRDIAASQVDAQFLQRTIDTIEKHLSDFEFDVDGLARKMAMSRRQLFRKLKAISGGTPNGLIRALRLQRAAQLLRDSAMTVTEITYAVGFSDLKHFRMVFKEQFGVLPGDYSRKRSNE